MSSRIVVLLFILLFAQGCTSATGTKQNDQEASPLPPSPLLMQIGSGWMAHMVCSSVFISGRTLDHVMAVEFGPGSDPVLSALMPQVDVDRKTVTVPAPEYDYEGQTAVYRDGLGCALSLDEPVKALRAVTIPPRQIRYSDDELWPQGERVYTEDDSIDYGALQAAMDSAIGHSVEGRGTRGVVVVHRGRLVGEAYAPGYSPRMALYGASMTKTVNAMLIGRLVQAGKLSVTDTRLHPQWGHPGDPRGAITLDELLRAVSGLEFVENYAGDADVNVMLLTKKDMAGFAATKPLVAEPGTHWSYSSGTANIISGIARATFKGDDDAWLRYPDEALFEPLGLRTAIFETDTAGTFVGSSFLWASPRDFARLGLLMLQDGVWEDERLLPEGWVDYMATPHPGNENLNYGAQTWLSGAKDARGPAPFYYMSGFGGQTVWMDPEHELVIVRMGWDFATDPWHMNDFADVVAGTISNPR
ncbi:MAG: serine hydrolase [Pseudomonadales bacterium]|nr:serine hydrolase [Pseudomonadales bacterium]